MSKHVDPDEKKISRLKYKNGKPKLKEILRKKKVIKLDKYIAMQNQDLSFSSTCKIQTGVSVVESLISWKYCGKSF